MQHHQQQQNSAFFNAADDNRKKVKEKIYNTALVVMENISKIFNNGTPTTSNCQHNLSSAAEDSTDVFPHSECVRLSSLVPQAATTSVYPNLISSPFDFSSSDVQPTVQNFASSLNELNSSAFDQENGSDDDIIWLDSSTCSEVPLQSENVSSSISQSSSSLTGADFLVPASPCPAQFANASNTVLPTYDAVNHQQQNAKVDVFKDETVVAFLHHYAEWSIKYPYRVGAFKLLIEAVQRRAFEIGEDFNMDKKAQKALKGRICAIRKRLRKKQEEMVGAQQRQMHEQKMAILRNMITQRQQNQTSSTCEQSEDGRNSSTIASDEDEIEILGCYQHNEIVSTADFKANATSAEDEKKCEQKNGSSNGVTANDQFIRAAEDAFAQLRSEVDEEIGEDTTAVIESDAASKAKKATAAVIETNAASKEETKGVNESGAASKEETKAVNEINAASKEENKGVNAASKEENKGVNESGAAPKVVKRPTETIHLAKRSKPFNRTVAENAGLRKKFARIPAKGRDTFGLIEEGGGIINCNQQLLDSLKNSNPTMFLRTDEFLTECSDGKNKSFDASLGQISEFDEFFTRWLSKIEQEERKRNNEGDKTEEEESEQEEGEGRVFRGPVIKCPRLPRVRVRIFGRTVAELEQEL